MGSLYSKIYVQDTVTLSLWNYNLDTKTLSEDISNENYIMLDTIIEHLIKTHDKKTLVDYLINEFNQFKKKSENIVNPNYNLSIVNNQIIIIYAGFAARLAMLN